MPTMIELLGQQAVQQNTQGVGSGLSQAVTTGMQLAQANQQLKLQKEQMAAAKEDLMQKQTIGLGNKLKFAAFAPNNMTDTTVRQAKAYADQAGIPFDDEGFRALLRDPETRLAMQKGINDVLSGKVPSEQFMQAAGSSAAMLEAISPLITQNAMAQNKQMNATELALLRQNQQMSARDAAEQARDDRQEKRFKDQDIREFRKGASALADDFSKKKIPSAVSSIRDITKIAGNIYSDEATAKFDKIAGTKGFLAALKVPLTNQAPLQNVALKGDDKRLYQSVASLRNQYLNIRSGAAVSDHEALRFLEELGQGSLQSGKDLQYGVQVLTNALKEEIANLEAGQDPEALKIYRERKGSVSSEDEVFQPPKNKEVETAPPPAAAQAPFNAQKFIADAKAMGKSDAEIQAFLAKKGIK